MSSETFSPRVCIIGAGFSGICSAVKLIQSGLNVTSLAIFDKNAKVGGVWASTRYPGVCVDVPAPGYCFNTDPKLDWTKCLPEGDEIQNYAESMCSKYNLWPHIHLQTEVDRLVWNENDQTWTATIKYDNGPKTRVEEHIFDIVFLGTGPIRVPKIPEEFENFKGLVMHTAQWDPSVTLESLKDKNVGIVGTGESGTQLTRTLGPKVKSLHIYQRNAVHFVDVNLFSWIYKLQPYARLNSFFSSMLFWIIFLLYTVLNFAFKSGSWVAKLLEYITIRHLHYSIPPEKSALCQALTPNEEVLCRPIAFEFGFYKTLLLPNVKLHSDPIVSIKADGLVTSNPSGTEKHEHLDVLILATGYKTDEYFGPMKIYGRGGVDILESWKSHRNNNYLGILNSKMPNLFQILGIAPLLPALVSIESQVAFAIRLLKIMANKNKRCIHVKPHVQADYERDVERSDSKMAYSKCSSHYVNSKGQATFWHHWSPPYYLFKLRFINQSDYIFE